MTLSLGDVYKRQWLVGSSSISRFTGSSKSFIMARRVRSPPESTLTFFRYNEQPDRYMTHWHNATEMIVALENCYTVTVQNQIFHLQPGDILVVPPGALHSIQGNPKGEGSRFIFLFELTIFNSMYDFRFVRSAFSNAVLINQTTLFLRTGRKPRSTLELINITRLNGRRKI